MISSRSSTPSSRGERMDRIPAATPTDGAGRVQFAEGCSTLSTISTQAASLLAPALISVGSWIAVNRRGGALRRLGALDSSKVQLKSYRPVRPV